MENEVVIHVRAEDDTAAGFAKVKQAAKKLGEDLERELKQSGKKAGASLADGIRDGLRAHEQGIKRVADSIGDAVEREMKESGRDAGDNLGDGIEQGLRLHAGDITGQVSAIGEDVEAEMEKSGKAAGEKFGKGVQDGMKGSGGSGGGGSFAARLLPDMGKIGAQGGKTLATSLMSSIGEGLASAKNPAIAGGIMAALATVAPLIGAAVGAAVIGGAGALGIAGGFAAAASDPRVRGAATALKDIVSDDMEKAGAAFAPSAVAAIGQVRTAWKQILPDIEGVFDSSRTLIEPFLDGILDGVGAVVVGIEDALGSAGPVMEGFGDLFRSIGQDVGEVFTDLSDDGPALADSLAVLAGAISVTTDAVTWLIEASATWLAQGPMLKREALELGENLRPLGEALGILEDQTGKVSIENGVWHDSAVDAAEGMNAQIESMRILESEMRKQVDPMFAVLDAQDQVRLAQEKYNKAVKASGPESAKAKEALRKMGEASIDLSGKMTTAANEGFDGKLTPAMRAAMRAANMNKKEMDALEKELMAAWRASNKWAGDYYANYTVRYSTVGNKTGNFGAGGDFSGVGGLAHGGIAGAANGSMSSGMTMVGEAGPELVKLPAGTQVSSNPDTRRKMSDDYHGRQRGGAVETLIRFDPSSASKLARAIMESLRAEIRAEGGNVQTVLGVG